jgi:tetratricopeptide (TPR) repeat protein
MGALRTTMDLLAQAGRAYQEKDFARAAILCNESLEANPLQPNALSLLGFAYLALGRAGDAAAVCQQALRIQPDHFDAHQALGIALGSQQKWREAEAHFQYVVQSRPELSDGYNNLGIALREQGRSQEAEACYRQALRLNPNSAEAFNNLGNALRDLGKLTDAEASFHQALRLVPNYADAYHNLGLALIEQRKLAEAEAALRRAIQLKPNHAAAHRDLAQVSHALAESVAHGKPAVSGPGHTGRGSLPTETRVEILAQAGEAYHAGDHNRALELCRQVLDREPLQPNALSLLGFIYLALDRPGEAIDACRQAIQANASNFDAYNALGAALASQQRWPEAEASFRQVIALNPELSDAYSNLAITLKELGKHQDAETVFRRAIQLNPNHAGAHYNLAMLLLLLGDYALGWEEYEWRWPVLHGVPLGGRPSTQPVWDGSPLNGRTILLYAEQGLGDTIQFLRFAPLVRDRGGRVVVEVQPALVGVLEGCPGIDQIVPQGGALPEFDVQASLMSLPRILNTRNDTTPASVPYLTANHQRIAYWQREFNALPGFKVGIVWQGNPKHRNDRIRSAPLAIFAHLAQLDGVQLISLQKGAGREQLPAFTAKYSVFDWGARADEGTGSLADLAAVIKSLDLVVTVDTAPAHLAGALGVPVWVAVPLVPDWRWLLDREDSPWYPTMRLVRQTRNGDWDDVFARIARAIVEFRANRHGPESDSA